MYGDNDYSDRSNDNAERESAGLDNSNGNANGINSEVQSARDQHPVYDHGVNEQRAPFNDGSSDRYRQDPPYRSADIGMRGVYSGAGQNNYSHRGYDNYNVPPRQDRAIHNGYQNARETYQDKKPRGGLAGRVAIAAIIGLAFGLFAAGGFFGASRLMEMAGVSAPAIESKTPAPAIQNSSSTTTDTSAAAPRVSQISQSSTTVVTDISEMVEKVMPAMVSITNNYTERANFFGQTFESPAQSGGSGIIVGENDSEYLIVTNQHVISGANNLLVLFLDGNEVNAYVKGYDSGHDIAVIAVPKSDVEASTKSSIIIATLGDSDALSLGEPTIAIGNAMGYGQSVTTGVVSALDREIGNGGKDRYIQTDAAINPGNSGGALLNINGEVIGINSSKLGGSIIEGMGYAIPISTVKPLIEDFMNRNTRGEKAAEGKKAYLGITGVDVTEDVSETYNMPKGVYIAQVHESAAAEKAGIEMGDIITKFDGSSITSMTELQDILSYYTEGTEVEVEIQRGSPGGYETKILTVILGNKNDMPPQ